MADLTQSLLEALARQSRQQPLPSLSGVVRLEVNDGDSTDQWYLNIAKGVVTVAREGGEPDCVLSGDRTAIDAVLSGESNAMAALLRGAIELQGKPLLLLGMQRLFPSEDIDAAPSAGWSRRQS
jgi:putative sterol carrier protein